MDYLIPTLRFYLTRIGPWIFSTQKFIWFEKDLAIDDPHLKSKIPARFLILDDNTKDKIDWDREKILNLRGTPGLRQFYNRWTRGDVMAAAYCSEKFAAFIWIRKRESSYRSIEGKWAHTYDAWTFNAYRGNSLMPMLQQVMFDYCRENWDVTHIDTFVGVSNIPSKKGDIKAGYKPKREFLRIRFFGREFRFT